MLWQHQTKFLSRVCLKAYRTYKENFQAQQGGKITLALSSGWAVPKTDTAQDKAAADRYLQFHLGIFAHPIFVNGDYPDVVKNIVGNRSEAAGIPSRLPSFTEDEKMMIKGSYDLFGLNHYSTDKVENKPAGKLLEVRNIFRMISFIGFLESHLLTASSGCQPINFAFRPYMRVSEFEN